MTALRPFEALRKEYVERWDAYQFIAHENAGLIRDGVQPSNEQLMRQRIAAEAAEAARRTLESAMRLGH